MVNKQKLELTWIGKDTPVKVEPRILVHDPTKDYGDKATDNMLIYGDNLLALKALEQDYAGKIKCIYIDPPYNIGVANNQVYDDNKEHSEWLQLMYSRIEVLYKLLAPEGVIFVQIDDFEQAYLRLIMDEIFLRKNFIACLPAIMNLKGNQDQFGFAGCHEYVLCYAKSKGNLQINNFNVEDVDNLEWAEDDIGLYKKGAPLRATGEEGLRENRPSMFYPLLWKDGVLSTIPKEEFNSLYNKETKQFNDVFLKALKIKYEKDGYTFILPMVDTDNYGRWRWGYTTSNIARLGYDVLVCINKGKISLYKKQRPELGDLPTKKPKSFLYRPEYSSGNGTAQIKKLFGDKKFPYPKPEELIADIIHLGSNPGDWVLDSFLGSGTTAAVAHKMGRKYIGIELGEHCHTHCIPRLQKVIDGTDQGGISKAVNWHGGGGFKYYYLAPSLLNKDKYGQYVISKEYNADMLAAAVAKNEGFKYAPSQEQFWKQGQSSEADFIYTTTNHVGAELLSAIAQDMKPGESLLICCKSFDSGLSSRFANITVKKIPAALLGRCEFGKDNYNLNIINPPVLEEEEE
ncbi:site-specific DNA-methyltransferase [Candidatus Proelusimicrobium volucris]|uniref:site-specific DNA-methyltransferase n=1 Tax=Candidatus Proelusimicrobium volucris TaxID=3416225 RepID=UPI003D0B6C0B